MLTTIITFAAMWYIYSKMNKIKPQIIYDRRRARYESCLALATLP